MSTFQTLRKLIFHFINLVTFTRIVSGVTLSFQVQDVFVHAFLISVFEFVAYSEFKETIVASCKFDFDDDYIFWCVFSHYHALPKSAAELVGPRLGRVPGIPTYTTFASILVPLSCETTTI